MLFGDFIVVHIQHKGRRFGTIEDFHLFAQHFHHARWHVTVFGAFRAFTHPTHHFQYKFITHTFSQTEGFNGIRVEHHLGNPFTVTQVNKYHPTVVAAAMCPAAKSDGFINIGFINLAAIMAAHGVSVLLLFYNVK